MCILEGQNQQQAQNQEQARSESFCGFIKSFNTRRGFGFVSCEETAQRFGRDVYLSKDEAMVLAQEPTVGMAWLGNALDMKSKVPPPVQEGDFLLFKVKLSTEGFPQAVQPQRIRRLRGVVREASSATADGIIVVTGGDDSDGASKQLLGAEVSLRQAEGGQLQLLPNDEVAFCCVNIAAAGGAYLEAQLVDLLCTQRADGAVLGCFSLSLPLLQDDGAPVVQLHGHALANIVVLSDIPANLCVPDLMRLFEKLGAVDATVTKASRSACISFDGPESIAKFLVQATHTISENGITKLAHVGPCLYRQHGGPCQCCSSNSSACCMSSETSPASNHELSLCSCIAVAADSRPLDGNATTAPAILSSTPMPSPKIQNPINFGCFLEQDSAESGCLLSQSHEMPMVTRTSTSPAWRCMHGSIVLPTAAPEILAGGANNCSVCIQWPTSIHAHAYIVELVDQGTLAAQRFTHVTPAGVLPALMNFRVEGLQPSAHAACIRCVAPCGCESPPSPWSFVSGVVTHTAPHSVAMNAPCAPMLAPPPCAPLSTTPPFCHTPTPVRSLVLTAIPEDSDAGSVENCPDDVLTLD